VKFFMEVLDFTGVSALGLMRLMAVCGAPEPGHPQHGGQRDGCHWLPPPRREPSPDSVQRLSTGGKASAQLVNALIIGQLFWDHSSD
jgi:hypothetical protein